jgi:hypothetical protein
MKTTRTLTSGNSQLDVPKGQLKIAQRFNAGSPIAQRQVPKGRLKEGAGGTNIQSSLRDSNWIHGIPGVETPAYSRDVPPACAEPSAGRPGHRLSDFRKALTRTHAANFSMNRPKCRQVLECAGRAKLRRHFGLPPNGQGIAELRRARPAESKAAWRFASRRTPKRLHVGECAAPKPWMLSMNRKVGWASRLPKSAKPTAALLSCSRFRARWAGETPAQRWPQRGSWSQRASRPDTPGR